MHKPRLLVRAYFDVRLGGGFFYGKPKGALVEKGAFDSPGLCRGVDGMGLSLLGSGDQAKVGGEVGSLGTGILRDLALGAQGMQVLLQLSRPFFDRDPAYAAGGDPFHLIHHRCCHFLALLFFFWGYCRRQEETYQLFGKYCHHYFHI